MPLPWVDAAALGESRARLALRHRCCRHRDQPGLDRPRLQVRRRRLRSPVDRGVHISRGMAEQRLGPAGERLRSTRGARGRHHSSRRPEQAAGVEGSPRLGCCSSAARTDCCGRIENLAPIRPNGLEESPQRTSMWCWRSLVVDAARRQRHAEPPVAVATGAGTPQRWSRGFVVALLWLPRSHVLRRVAEALLEREAGPIGACRTGSSTPELSPCCGQRSQQLSPPATRASIQSDMWQPGNRWRDNNRIQTRPR